MNAIDFVVRNNAGMVERDVLQAGAETTMLQMTSGAEVSFNVSQGDVQGYQRVGGDLRMTLADGRIIVLQDYFANFAEEPRLFVSSDGLLHEVFFAEGDNGLLFAEYGRSAEWGKWSPNDELIHFERAEIMPAAGAYDGEESEVSMLAAGLLGGSSLFGLGAAGAVGAATLINGPGDDGDGGPTTPTTPSNGPRAPTVDDTAIVVGGDGAEEKFVVTGTGEPGDVVSVTVGGETVKTTIGSGGTWEATFEGGDFPADGSYDADVVVGTQGGDVSLDGPAVTIDLTPPDIEATAGVQSTNHAFNAQSHAQGVTITGTGEPGTDVNVTIGQYSHTATVGGDGSWSVTFSTTEVEPGTYTRDVVITSEDAYGNTSSITRSVEIDTETTVTMDTSAVGGADNVVNGAEQTGTVTIGGTAEAGATVVLTVNGTGYPGVVAGANGAWSVTVPAGALPTGELTVPVSVQARDVMGNSSTANGSIEVDTLVNTLTMTSTPGGADQVVNLVESQNGVILSGQVEPGSSLRVSFGGTVKQATVANDGSWTVGYSANQVPQGDLQNVAVVMTATDAAGNQRTENASIKVDTDAGYLTISSAPIEGDDVVNAAEAADGVTITGTATPNTLVTVSIGNSSTQVMSTGTGQWSATFQPTQLPADTANAEIKASLTDAAGNVLNAADSVAIDTVVENQNFGNLSFGADDYVNASEAGQGVVVTGTTEIGASSVVVSLNGQDYPASLNSAAGTWSVTLPSGAFPANYENDAVPIEVKSTDRAGNVDTINSTIKVDTWVNELSLSSDSNTADGVVSAAELRSNGLQLSGQVEPGSSLEVVFNGQTYNANVTANGAWTLTIPGANVPGGDGISVPMTLRATDEAGNVRSEPGSVMIDTVAPEGPEVQIVMEARDGVAGIYVDSQTETQNIYEVEAGGSVSAVSKTAIDTGSRTIYDFSETVPNGSHLVVTSEDNAGNTRGTVLVLEDGAAGTQVDMANPNLGAMNVDTIQLEFAEDAELTLTEADIVALSAETNTVKVTGGNDDQVNIRGAQGGNNVNVDGETFVEYTLGDATILIDTEITNVVT